MTTSTGRTLFWRNTLMVGAGICMVCATVAGYEPWRALASLPVAVATILVAIAGLFAALGIREFAALLFDVNNKPWYAQRGGFFFLLLMLTAIDALCCVAVGALPRAEEITRVIPLPALISAASAATLAWIVLLDWPRRSLVRPADHARDAKKQHSFHRHPRSQDLIGHDTRPARTERLNNDNHNHEGDGFAEVSQQDDRPTH